jgi:hypothetical protein
MHKHGTRSTKLPNPPIFIDSKDLKFSNWLSRIKNKLHVNEDHYLNKLIKLAYVKGRIKGKATMYISLCLYKDALNLYNTMQDLFDYLKSVYEDLNQLFTAKNKFKKLYIKPI